MNSVFASASALLASSFIESFTEDHLNLVLGRIGKETGVKIDRNNDRLIITGKWSWLLESHDILLEESRNISEFRFNLQQSLTDENTQQDDHSNSSIVAANLENYNAQNIPVTIQAAQQSNCSGQFWGAEELTDDYVEVIPDQFKSVNHKDNSNADDTVIADTPDEECANTIHIIKAENQTNSETDDKSDEGDDTDNYIDDFRDQNEAVAHTVITIKSKCRKQKNEISDNLSFQKNDFSDIVKLEPYVYEEKGFISDYDLTADSLLTKLSKKKGNTTIDLKCSLCDFVGKDRRSIKAHTRRCHLKKFKCDQCTSSFGYNKDLTRHKKQIHSATECTDETPEKITRRGRKKRPKKKDPDAVFACDKCPYVGKVKALLQEHKRRLHSIRFQCDQCDKSFGYNKDLNRHKRHVHCEAEYMCKDCKKLFKTQRSLNIHSKCHEAGYDKHAFACQLCNKRYSTKYVLDYHMKSEHMGMKKSYVCPLCGKSFTQKSSYRQHANVHAGIRPYVCEVCGKSFSYENGLKAHKYIHDDLRRFQCKICDKRFLHRNSLRIHRSVHQKTHDYMCTQCGRSFTQKQSLVRHERIHTGDKPYLCTICQKSFRDASIIRRHVILMHKRDPKKWQNDIINNAVKVKSFYVEVLGSGSDLPPEVKQQDFETAMETAMENLNKTALKTTSSSLSD